MTMIICHCRRVGLLTLLATFAVSTANAQSTNCMAMGSNMVQCYGADGSSTNCMAMGPNMAHCDTIGGQSQPRAPQANASDNGGSWLDDLMPWREGNFRKKIGKMIAAGDCQGAAKLAYEKGRLELGAQIAKTCSPAIGR
jgi:putative hemolysin